MMGNPTFAERSPPLSPFASRITPKGIKILMFGTRISRRKCVESGSENFSCSSLICKIAEIALLCRYSLYRPIDASTVILTALIPGEPDFSIIV